MTVRIEGTIPFVRVRDADIRFQIDGDEFTYWRFHMPKASAGVYWHDDLLEVTKVIAKFDNGEPAVLERNLAKGRVVLLASGWHPDESQLALSTKFVPLIGALLDQACGTNEALASVVVGQPVEILPSSAAVVVTKPDGRERRKCFCPKALIRRV